MLIRWTIIKAWIIQTKATKPYVKEDRWTTAKQDLFSLFRPPSNIIASALTLNIKTLYKIIITSWIASTNPWRTSTLKHKTLTLPLSFFSKPRPIKPVYKNYSGILKTVRLIYSFSSMFLLISSLLLKFLSTVTVSSLTPT